MDSHGEELDITTDDGLLLAARLHRSRLAGDRPLVVAVHGYPDNSGVWEAVLPHLLEHADVLTYDVRGVGRSQEPTAREGYRLDRLAGDVDAVVREARTHSACVHLLAHDWGSIQVWQAVTGSGDSASACSFTSISGPCLDHVGRWFSRTLRPASGEFAQGLRQARASAYIPFFRLPGLAEVAGRTGLLKRVMNGDDENPAALPGVTYRRRTRDIVNGLQLYRANMLTRSHDGDASKSPRTTDVPVHIVQLTRDRYVLPPLAACGEPYTSDFTTSVLDAGHWAVLTDANAIADACVTHLQRCAHHASAGA